MGDYGYGERNERGEKLKEWLWQQGLCACNSLFSKNKNKKWTWKSPDGKTKNEIDFILTNKKAIVEDVSVLNNFEYNSDHRLVRAIVKINHKTKRYHTQKQKNDIRKIMEDKDMNLYLDQLMVKCKWTSINKPTIQETYDLLENGILSSARNTILENNTNKVDKITEKTKKLIKERELLRQNEHRLTIEEKLYLKQLKKTCKKEARRDIQNYNDRIVKQIIEESKSIKNANKALYHGKEWIVKLTKNNKTIQKRKSINETATDFFKTLYSSTLNEEESEKESPNINEDEEVLPIFLHSEIEKSIDELPNGKCFGNDSIKAEMLKLGKKELITSFTNLFNKILESEEIPAQWKESTIILLHKKGDKENLNNYRPISIISTIYKIFSKCIFRRIRTILDEHQPREQAGFRKGFSTTVHLQTINQVIEKSTEYQKTLNIAFIDFRKAFDTIEHVMVWKALKNQNVPNKIIRILKNLYTNSSAKISLESKGNMFKLNRGVRQGDPMSPAIFCAVLEEIFKSLNWNSYGIKIEGEYLNNLRFADDITIFSSSTAEMKIMLQELESACRVAGLKMNVEKSKLMSNGIRERIVLNNQEIEYVDEYIYLGQLIAIENRQDKEINNRITRGWNQFWKHKSILESNLTQTTRAFLFDAAVLPVLTYGSQTWNFSVRSTNKLQIAQRGMERSILKVSRRQKIRNSTIRKRTGFTDVIQRAKQQKWNWGGHIARLHDNRWTSKTTKWTPRDNTRRVGRQLKRWRDDLEKVCKSWEQLAQDKTTWKIRGEAYVQS